MEPQDTFTALSTPHGESALGVIRCSGSLCMDLIHSIFGKESPTPRHAYYANYTDLEGNFLDQVVYSYFEKDASYTGDPMLEISCHGNPFILQHILKDLVTRGCRHALPGEFTQTAFMNGKLDLSQAEAVIDLIKARTELSFKAASNQLQGSLSRRINNLVEDLLQIVAEIEAYIDFPEEDLPAEGENAPKQKIESLIDQITSLSETAQTGIYLREGVKAIIIGEPNAGKSSLMNCLLNESRAIVSDRPGTTRDYIEASFFVKPYRINIIDTAGIHETEDSIEQEGIHKTLEQIALSDIILLTIDSSAPPPSFDLDVFNLLIPGKTIVIKNKSDLPEHTCQDDQFESFRNVSVSATEQTGTENLRNAIADLLGEPKISNQGDVVAVSARHNAALEIAKSELKTASNLLQLEEPAELVANHLREAMTNLEAIVGRIDNERMLDKLFTSFCIGK